MSKGKGKVSDMLAIILLCKDMRWTYQQYSSQPAWLLEGLQIVGNVDARYQEAANRRANKK